MYWRFLQPTLPCCRHAAWLLARAVLQDSLAKLLLQRAQSSTPLGDDLVSSLRGALRHQQVCRHRLACPAGMQAPAANPVKGASWALDLATAFEVLQQVRCASWQEWTVCSQHLPYSLASQASQVLDDEWSVPWVQGKLVGKLRSAFAPALEQARQAPGGAQLLEPSAVPRGPLLDGDISWVECMLQHLQRACHLAARHVGVAINPLFRVHAARLKLLLQLRPALPPALDASIGLSMPRAKMQVDIAMCCASCCRWTCAMRTRACPLLYPGGLQPAAAAGTLLLHLLSSQSH